MDFKGILSINFFTFQKMTEEMMIDELHRESIGFVLDSETDANYVKLFVEKFKQNTTIRKFTLHVKELPKGSSEQIFTMLTENRTLKKLRIRLSTNIERCKHIPKMIRGNTVLETLEIFGGNIDLESIREISEAIASNNCLKELSLFEARIDGDKHDCIASVLTKNTTLKSLNFYHNPISIENCKSLGKALQVNTSLTQLCLNYTSIRIDGCKHLAESLRSNNTLTCLNMNHAGIGDTGCEYIAEMLAENTSLLRLKLCTNNIGDLGHMALSKALKENNTLRVLELFGNFFKFEGLRALGEMIKVNTGLEQLAIPWGDSKEVEEFLLECLAENHRIMSVSFYDKRIVKEFNLNASIKNYLEDTTGKVPMTNEMKEKMERLGLGQFKFIKAGCKRKRDE